MRYMARRIRTGEWLTRDLVLTDVENTVSLSGPGTITGNLEPGLGRYVWSDGLRLAEDWGTMIYAVAEDTDDVINHGIVLPPTAYDDEARITCAGVSSYANGYIFNESKLWGPQAAKKGRKGRLPIVEIPRPDPIEIFVDHWRWIQQQHGSDLNVTITGDTTTRPDAQSVPLVTIGNYAEPYRLRKWEAPDLGSEMESLAQETPFDYAERVVWADAEHRVPQHEIQVGYPRLGRQRDDLRFAMGENVALVPSVQTVEGFANHLIGLGTGEAGPSMAYAELEWDDGRLRRTRVLTDKEAKQGRIARRLRVYQAALNQRFDVTQVSVVDHPNARISQLQLGDDIRVLAEHPEFGEVDLWVRILSISRGESDEAAALTTSASSFFIYNPSEELA